MKRSVSCWQMGGFVFTAVVGTLLHFLFDWTGGNVAVALFSAVNESIWEHLKLLFYPIVAFAMIAYFCWGKKVPEFWCIKLTGILSGQVLIPVVYYTYTGILGMSADWVNIAIFFLVAGAVYYLEAKLLQRGVSCSVSPKTAVAMLCLLCVIFTVLTFVPPEIPLFQDPITGTYGFQK